jgi:hypothetical protein
MKKHNKAPKAELVTITPKQAAALLKNNTYNRPISKAWVNSLAALLVAGVWKVLGNPVKITLSGKIADGQHRLEACVQADVPMETYILRDQPEDSVEYQDEFVRKRSASDAAALAFGEPVCRTTIAGLRLVLAYRAEASGYLKKTNADIIELLRGDYKDIVEVGKATTANMGIFKKSGAMVAALFIIHKDGKNRLEDVQEFFDTTKSGTDLPAGDSRAVLYKALVRSQMQRDGADYLGRIQMLKSIIWGWNKYVRGTPAKNIRFPVGILKPDHKAVPKDA